MTDDFLRRLIGDQQLIDVDVALELADTPAIVERHQLEALRLFCNAARNGHLSLSIGAESHWTLVKYGYNGSFQGGSGESMRSLLSCLTRLAESERA